MGCSADQSQLIFRETVNNLGNNTQIQLKVGDDLSEG